MLIVSLVGPGSARSLELWLGLLRSSNDDDVIICTSAVYNWIGLVCCFWFLMTIVLFCLKKYNFVSLMTVKIRLTLLQPLQLFCWAINDVSFEGMMENFQCPYHLLNAHITYFVIAYFQVTWLKSRTGKFFQFIKNRNPPFRNFTISGADIDVSTEMKCHINFKINETKNVFTRKFKINYYPLHEKNTWLENC